MDGEAWKLRQKESSYRKLYSNLLQKHRGVLQQAPSPSQPESSSSSLPRPSPPSNIVSSIGISRPSPPPLPHAPIIDPYNDETITLNHIFRTEVGNLVVGVVSTAATFMGLRFGKTRILTSSSLFGNKTAETFQQAQTHARKYGTESIQNNIGTHVHFMLALT